MLPCAAISALFLAIAAAPPDGEGELAGSRTMALLRSATADDGGGIRPHAATRRVRATRRGSRTTLEIVGELDAERAGWLTGALVSGELHVRSVTIDGKPAATITDGATTTIAA